MPLGIFPVWHSKSDPASVCDYYIPWKKVSTLDGLSIVYDDNEHYDIHSKSCGKVLSFLDKRVYSP